MAKASKRKTAPAKLDVGSRSPALPKWWPAAVLVLVTLACYWVPMTSSSTTILWDAADYYQVVQNHLSHELHLGRIPWWTPYPWSGYPFLADPQVGAWYPPNWPFFLLGVSPRMLVVEHWLHALLAAFGAYLLALRLTGHRPGAVVAGLTYGLSGFYVGHSSHTTMLQCAAWTPWILLAFDRAVESRAVRNTVWGGIAAGMMILAGHFQTILYSFAALALFALARWIRQPRRVAAILAIAVAIPMTGTALSALATAPGLELAAHSVRASLQAVKRTEGVVPLSALATLVDPDYYGVFTDHYRGPQDITQFYFYGGILLVPLALAGWRNRAVRWAGLLLTVPVIWYAMGQPAGLYLLVARLPGFSSVRAPANIWFVPSLGLGLLAGAGLAAISGKWTVRWLPAAVVAFFCVDLFWFQSATNPLAYGRVSYEEAYGSKEDLFRRAVASGLPPLTRFDAPEHLPVFGPMSHFLDTYTEVTYGYGPMPFAWYDDYVKAMAGNPRLRNGLNVSRVLDAEHGSILANADALPRANFPRELVRVVAADEKPALATLDQRRQALVPKDLPAVTQDGNGTSEVTAFAGGHYTIHYRCATASVLRVGNAYFPGWTARTGGRELPVFAVDHALLGTLVPAGEGDVEFDYRSRFFPAGLAVTLAGAAACAGLLWWDKRRAPESSGTESHATHIAS